MNVNENYFWNIKSVQDYLNARYAGFPADYYSTNEILLGATMLHQAVRICSIDLINELITFMDVNEFDNNNCTPLGYLINDDLMENLTDEESFVSTIYDGCNDAELIIETIRLLRDDYQADCIYYGEEYDDEYIETYINELQKHVFQINGLGRREAAKQIWEGDIDFDDLPEELKMDKKFVLILLSEKGFGSYLEVIDESFTKDKEIVMVAVKQNGENLEFADESLKKDKEIVMAAISSSSYGLNYADESFKNDRDIVLKAVQANGFAIKYADITLKADKELAIIALDYNNDIFQFIDDSLKKDKKFVLEYFKDRRHKNEQSDPFSFNFKHYNLDLKYVDDSLKNDREIALEAVKANKWNFEYVDESLKKDPELLKVSKKG
jgi:hypothetical protein